VYHIPVTLWQRGKGCQVQSGGNRVFCPGTGQILQPWPEALATQLPISPAPAPAKSPCRPRGSMPRVWPLLFRKPPERRQTQFARGACHFFLGGKVDRRRRRLSHRCQKASAESTLPHYHASRFVLAGRPTAHDLGRGAAAWSRGRESSVSPGLCWCGTVGWSGLECVRFIGALVVSLLSHAGAPQRSDTRPTARESKQPKRR
jgi:hypothetical protein